LHSALGVCIGSLCARTSARGLKRRFKKENQRKSCLETLLRARDDTSSDWYSEKSEISLDRISLNLEVISFRVLGVACVDVTMS